MTTDRITIPDGLADLKPSRDLKSVSMSSLARKGTSVLRDLVSGAHAVAIKIQGQGSMVTLSQHQYDEMVELIRKIRDEESPDGFAQTLSQQFDDLVSGMNQPGAAEATGRALFGTPDALNATYQPGVTER